MRTRSAWDHMLWLFPGGKDEGSSCLEQSSSTFVTSTSTSTGRSSMNSSGSNSSIKSTCLERSSGTRVRQTTEPEQDELGREKDRSGQGQQ